jgi:GNAT superfamily N-acetyltransferase
MQSVAGKGLRTKMLDRILDWARDEIVPRGTIWTMRQWGRGTSLKTAVGEGWSGRFGDRVNAMFHVEHFRLMAGRFGVAGGMKLR